MKQDIRIGDDVRDVLANATIEGNILRLPPDLDRKLYQRVDQALSALGGAWNRKQRGHVFAGDPRTAIDAAADSGKVAHPNQLDFFPTSDEPADRVAARLNATPAHRILEPSAGEGALVAAVLRGMPRPPLALALIEKDPGRVAVLREKFQASLFCDDFLGVSETGFYPFDKIAMNPPFHRGADDLHVMHALNFLAPGGRLVAIASSMLARRPTKPSKDLGDRLDAWGGWTIEPLPEGSFKAAGTNVATVMLTVDRPKGDA